MHNPLRNSRIDIDSDAIRHNLARVKQLAPHSRVMPVVKANGYGHGIADVYAACERADGFAVAMMAEAVQLRELGCERPIAVFHGFSSMDDLALAGQYDLQPTVHSASQLALLDAYQGEPLTVWLKIDTGMHRLGVDMQQAGTCLAHLEASPRVSRVHLMSHFANADDPGNSLNNIQLENFLKVKNNHAARLDSESSLANSAAIVSNSQSHFDWVRPGIMLYGGSPLLDVNAAELDLKPAMRFSSVVLTLRHCSAGEAIGYGSTWRCPQDMPVGIVAVGYADGYPRHASAGTPVAVNGQTTQLIGRVSMDSLYIDCRDIDVSVGDEVELWGVDVAVDSVARGAGTIAYELLCQAGNAQSQASARGG